MHTLCKLGLPLMMIFQNLCSYVFIEGLNNEEVLSEECV